MKTTLDLPPALVHEMKLKALKEGKNIKDVAADLLQKGLAMQAAPLPENAKNFTTELRSDGLPVVHSVTKAAAVSMTVEELLELERASLLHEDFMRIIYAV